MSRRYIVETPEAKPVSQQLASNIHRTSGSGKVPYHVTLHDAAFPNSEEYIYRPPRSSQQAWNRATYSKDIITASLSEVGEEGDIRSGVRWEERREN